MKSRLPRFILLSTVLAGGSYAARAFLAPPFSEAKIREYESALGWGGSSPGSGGAIPHRTGKVVIVRPSSWQVFRIGTLLLPQIQPGLQAKEKEVDPPCLDDAWYCLDPSLRASSPEEVATVVICDYRRIPVSEYRGIGDFSGPHASAKKGVYLKVYDCRSRSFIGQCLLAEDHEKLKDATAGRYTGRPEEIAAFVAKMPWRR